MLILQTEVLIRLGLRRRCTPYERTTASSHLEHKALPPAFASLPSHAPLHPCVCGGKAAAAELVPGGAAAGVDKFHAKLIFVLSQATVVDELKRRQRAVSLTFFDMLEVHTAVRRCVLVVREVVCECCAPLLCEFCSPPLGVQGCGTLLMRRGCAQTCADTHVGKFTGTCVLCPSSRPLPPPLLFVPGLTAACGCTNTKEDAFAKSFFVEFMTTCPWEAHVYAVYAQHVHAVHAQHRLGLCQCQPVPVTGARHTLSFLGSL